MRQPLTLVLRLCRQNSLAEWGGHRVKLINHYIKSTYGLEGYSFNFLSGCLVPSLVPFFKRFIVGRVTKYSENLVDGIGGKIYRIPDLKIAL